MKDLITAIEILRINELEHKDKNIYKDMTVYEVARSVYDNLAGSEIDSPVYTYDSETRKMLRVLYETKDINSPYFFSF